MVDRLVPEAMTRAHANAFGTTRSTLSRAVFTCSRFPARHAEAQRRRVGSVRVAHRLAATISRLKKKEPHDGTHYAALCLITPTSYFLILPSAFFYTSPIVASVGSSIADVTANPLSAW
jgi:hypothetical protein